MNQKTLRVAIDANEANTHRRVGSNVYAFEIIRAIYDLTKNNNDIYFTILLSSEPVDDMPPQHTGWQYKVIGPKLLWTQFAEPIFLFLNHSKIDVLFTPSHYAPRHSAVPYISSVMDLAYLNYPKQFNQNDLIQLKHWTKYSVKKAQKVITISQFTKSDIINRYQKKSENVIVAYPDISQTTPASVQETKNFFKKHQIRKPYFLFLGTIQPRKNLIRLIEAYEQLCRRLSSQQFKKGQKTNRLPQLVLAGKIGWLSDPIISRLEKSPFLKQIILTGYISESIKPTLYEQATASILLGLHEGFGIPPLESLQYGCLPIVSNTTSLPEVVGEAGFQVNPYDVKKIAVAMEKALKLSIKNKAVYRSKGKKQLKKFSWEKSAQIIIATIKQVAHEHSK
jgi:glycosyltransferase involved in cell wall biosynthesis